MSHRDHIGMSIYIHETSEADSCPWCRAEKAEKHYDAIAAELEGVWQDYRTADLGRRLNGDGMLAANTRAEASARAEGLATARVRRVETDLAVMTEAARIDRERAERAESALRSREIECGRLIECLHDMTARAEVAEADVGRMTAEIAVLEEDLALEEKWGEAVLRRAERAEAVLRRAERAEEQRDRARAWIRACCHVQWCDSPGGCNCGIDAALADDPPQRGDR